MALIDQFVASPAEADVLAQATLDDLSSRFVEAEGSCDANPHLVPGRQVNVTGIGQRFNGIYYVTQVLQEWTKEGGLQTHFTVGGRRDGGVWTLLGDATSRSPDLGLVVGIVTDNRDPEEMARVRVRFPWMSDQIESAWARLIAPMAGAGRGFLSFPEIDDEVLVGFEHGDIHRPFVMGALWNGQDPPPLQASMAVGGDGKVNQRIFKSRAGHSILLDDTAGGEEITIVDKTGENKIIFHSATNSMEIVVQGDLSIVAGGKITLRGSKGIDVESQQDVTVSAQTGIDVASQTQLRLSGQASAELTSPAQAKVSGSIVEISGTGPVQVTGTPILLN